MHDGWLIWASLTLLVFASLPNSSVKELVNGLQYLPEPLPMRDQLAPFSAKH